MARLWQYKEASEYILSVPKFTKKNEPQDTKAFWEFMGCPGNHQKIIHVAGTNGKGSVCSYLNAILREMGYSVGMFTSPHLIEMTERIQIDRVPVSKKAFTEAFSQVYEAVKQAGGTEKLSGYHPTFFEFLFFIGMVLFQQEGTDYIILETGLGGRLDATNCVPKPALTILTRIGLDHMEYLGNTIEEIAAEKAGIIKEGVPVITLDMPVKAYQVIAGVAEKKRASLCLVGTEDIRDLCFHKNFIDFSYQSRYYDYIRLRLSTGAVYQAENAALALRAAETLFGDNLTVGKMENAVKNAVWEGRMEEVMPSVYVDGAHNEDGISAFLDTVRQMRLQTERGRFLLLFSVVKEKNYAAMLQRLAAEAVFDEVVFAPLDNSRAVSCDRLKELAEPYGLSEICFGSVEEALLWMLSHRKEEDTIFAAGSLYLVGQIKAAVLKGSKGKG
ncbi:MAG: bifunctional folylpolyglutamate synthase/dihydrofolate synthase [Clostridiales bacterium]|nr:bifunctional folylpolyglutamate synthase/dihydrofolate synthase [Clostridiales bacterium]